MILSHSKNQVVMTEDDYKHLLAENKRLEDEIGYLRYEMTEKDSAYQELGQNYNELDIKYDGLNVELSIATDEIEELEKKLTTALEDVDDLKAEEKLNEKIIGDLEDELHDTRNELKAAVEQICTDMRNL